VSDRELAAKAGFDAFLVKPVAIDALRADCDDSVGQS
jgi:hypothetical protein